MRLARWIVVVATVAVYTFGWVIGGQAETRRALSFFPGNGHPIGRHTCAAYVYPPLVHVNGSHKGKHDTWNPSPEASRYRLGFWKTVSGPLRGCSNTVELEGPGGPVEVHVADPFHGRNRFHCKVTGSYRCDLDRPNSELKGDHLAVLYVVRPQS